METYTKKGLKIILISIIISTIGTILVSLLTFNFVESISTSNYDINFAINMLMTIIPGFIVAGIGSILLLIGAILMLVGRKEFGKKHEKFVMYALMIVIVSIVLGIALSFASNLAGFSNQLYSFGTPDSEKIISSYYTSTLINALSGIITACIGGLVWVFGLYHLEDKKGKNILYAAYASIVATAVISNMYIILFFEDIINTETIQSAINSGNMIGGSEILSLFQGLGDILIISLIGGIITNILLIYAVYLPYNRIKIGELKPIATKQSYNKQKRCMHCGRMTPSESIVCAYCGKNVKDDILPSRFNIE